VRGRNGRSEGGSHAVGREAGRGAVADGHCVVDAIGGLEGRERGASVEALWCGHRKHGIVIVIVIVIGGVMRDQCLGRSDARVTENKARASGGTRLTGSIMLRRLSIREAIAT
jgi:hypothetical protein